MKVQFRNTYFIFILIQGVLIELLCLAYLHFDSATAFKSNMQYHIVIYALACIPYFAAYYFIKRFRGTANQTKESRTVLLSFIIIAGFLFRLTLLPTHRSTSDDYYRYLWEGKVLTNGFNPYAVSPADSSLIPLRDSALWSNVTFKKYTSNYQPGAQVVFSLAYLIGGDSLFGLKCIYLLCEALLFWALLRLLRRRNLPDYFLLLYAWLPLPLFEYYVNGHLDVAALPFFILALFYADGRKLWKSALLFAVALLVKSYAIFALPFLLKRFSLRQKLTYIGIVGVVVIAAYLPFLNEQRSVLETLTKYLRNWEFNGSFYKLFVLLFQDSMRARLLCTGLFIALGGWIFLKGKDALKSTYLVYFLAVLFGTTVYPWYLGWLAVLHPFGEMLAVSALFVVINLSNLTPAADVWAEPTWAVVLEYTIVFLFFARDGWNYYKEKRVPGK
jgi:hypothetical protein